MSISRASRVVSTLAIAGLLGTSLTACSQSNESAGSGEQTFSSCGKEFTFEKRPEKVLSMGVTGLAYLVAAGAEDKIVGRANEYGEPPAEWMGTKVDDIEVLSELDISMESIVSLKPDLVYGGGYSYESASPDNIKEKGINAVVDNPECHYFYPDDPVDESFDNILGEVEKLGALLGTEEKAKKFATQYRDSVKSISEKAPGKGKSVSFAYYFGEDAELFSYGDEGVMSEVMKTLSLDNAIDLDYHPHQGPIAPEAFVQSDPDVLIVLVGMGGATKESTMERLKKIPGFNNMRAVKENKIYYANSAMAYASPTVFPYLETLANDIEK